MGKTKTPAGKPAAEHPLLEEFASDVPHEATAGEYAFCIRDRWHGQPTDLADGWHPAGSDWYIRVEGGLPQEALRSEHPRSAALDEFA